MMPGESGEKITLGISAMLNMTVFLMAVIGDLPPTDNTSIISIYYSLTLMVTTSVTCCEVLVLEMHFRSQHGDPIPPRLAKIAKTMAALTFSKLDINIHKQTGKTKLSS